MSTHARSSAFGQRLGEAWINLCFLRNSVWVARKRVACITDVFQHTHHEFWGGTLGCGPNATRWRSHTPQRLCAPIYSSAPLRSHTLQRKSALLYSSALLRPSTPQRLCAPILLSAFALSEVSCFAEGFLTFPVRNYVGLPEMPVCQNILE